MESDRELFEAWRGGDARAGSTLFDRYARELYWFFCDKVSENAAEDLVQETFLACVKVAGDFRGDSSFRTYLYTAARSRLYNYLSRVKAKNDKVDFGITTLHDLGPTPTGMVARRERDRVLLEALRRIPIDLQIAIELYYFEQIQGDALAEVLGVPMGTVRTRLRRARERLHEQLVALEAAGPLHDTVADLESWAAEIRKQR